MPNEKRAINARVVDAMDLEIEMLKNKLKGYEREYMALSKLAHERRLQLHNLQKDIAIVGDVVGLLNDALASDEDADVMKKAIAEVVGILNNSSLVRKPDKVPPMFIENRDGVGREVIRPVMANFIQDADPQPVELEDFDEDEEPEDDF